MNDEKGLGTRAAQLAQLAAKASKIAAAAGSGGPYGAAGEAARQFLPQLIKIVAVLLVVVLLLPVLILNAVPHIFFGWTGSVSDDITAVTEKAAELGGIYGRFDELLRGEIDALLTSFSEEEYETTINIQNADLGWLIAIVSVYYEQDLARINEASIQRMIGAFLDYSVEEDEDENTQLSIRYIAADALMGKLGFTEEQRAWAELLYESLSDMQIADTGDMPQGDGTDYQTSYPAHEIDGFVYFHQKDTRWAETPYGKTGTVGRSGCGPTALAMVVSTITGQTVTPPEVAEWSYQSGHFTEGVGSNHDIMPDGAKHYGIKAESVSRQSPQKIIEALSEGKMVVALMGKGHFTSSGHFIVLRGVTENGEILVADPNSVKRSERTWDLSLILSETKPNAGGGGPLWVMGTNQD